MKLKGKSKSRGGGDGGPSHAAFEQVVAQLEQLNTHFHEVDDRLNAVESQPRYEDLYGKDVFAYMNVLRIIAAKRLKLPREGDSAQKFVKFMLEQLWLALQRHVVSRIALGEESSDEDGFDVTKTIQLALDTHNSQITFGQYGFNDQLPLPEFVQLRYNNGRNQQEEDDDEEEQAEDEEEEGGEEEQAEDEEEEEGGDEEVAQDEEEEDSDDEVTTIEETIVSNGHRSQLSSKSNGDGGENEHTLVAQTSEVNNSEPKTNGTFLPLDTSSPILPADESLLYMDSNTFVTTRRQAKRWDGFAFNVNESTVVGTASPRPQNESRLSSALSPASSAFLSSTPDVRKSFIEEQKERFTEQLKQRRATVVSKNPLLVASPRPKEASNGGSSGRKASSSLVSSSPSTGDVTVLSNGAARPKVPMISSPVVSTTTTSPSQSNRTSRWTPEFRKEKYRQLVRQSLAANETVIPLSGNIEESITIIQEEIDASGKGDQISPDMVLQPIGRVTRSRAKDGNKKKKKPADSSKEIIAVGKSPLSIATSQQQQQQSSSVRQSVDGESSSAAVAAASSSRGKTAKSRSTTAKKPAAAAKGKKAKKATKAQREALIEDGEPGDEFDFIAKDPTPPAHFPNLKSSSFVQSRPAIPGPSHAKSNLTYLLNPLQSTLNQDLSLATNFSHFVTASESIINAREDRTLMNGTSTMTTESTVTLNRSGRPARSAALKVKSYRELHNGTVANIGSKRGKKGNK